MKLRNFALGVAAMGLALSAVAQSSDEEKVFDDRWRVHGMLGAQIADGEDLDNGAQGKIGFGKPISPYIMLDGHINYGELKTSKDDIYKRAATGLDILFFPFGAFYLDASALQPYFGLGLTYHEIEFVGDIESSYGNDAILGLTYELDHASLRAEARYQVDKIHEKDVLVDDYFYTYALMLGVSVPFGDKPKPFNYDSDGDGVPDRLDKCPNTPRGTPVDSSGCPLDSDGDGVPNFRDQCPNTPAGAKVNVNGCSIDDDRDGVPNDIDQCPNTPYGVPVDTRGCPLDTDNDGVPNKIDQCPGTLPGMKVNSRGCVISQTVELSGVHFEFDKARLMLDSKTVMSNVAKSLNNEPDVRIIIAGHTDSLGSDVYNKRLSQERAQSVVDFLISQGIDSSRLRAVGYGESKPVADNNTEEGRERNRRVELQVISAER